MSDAARLSGRRLIAVARKEAIQLRRDVRSLVLAFFLPVFLLVLFGYAIAWDIDEIPTAVLDQDRTLRSRELIDAFHASRYFTLERALASDEEVTPLLDRARVRIVIVIPPGFARDLDAGRPALVQAIVDGGDANTATIAIGYAEATVRSHNTKVLLETNLAAPRIPLRAETRIRYNEDLRSRNMIVPGLIAVIMMMIAAILTSLTIAREWERGTMEQLASTPVRRIEIVMGKLLPYLAIGLADIVMCSVLGVALFDVPFRGSPVLLLLLSFVFLVGALGLGSFISARARNQLLASQVAMLTTFLPAMLLSGFMYAIENLPTVLRGITYLVPARYEIVVTRGIFLKGVGLDVLWPQALAMAVFAAIGVLLSVQGYRKELR